MQDGLQIFWIAKRKFCVHVHTLRHLPNNFQCVSVTEERRLNGMAWDGSKSWFRNVSKDMKQQAINQYKLLSSFDV
jgi:hypothetical protein